MTKGHGLTRRQLLASGASAGAAALGASSLLETLAQAKPIRHGLGAIEHIVVFVQDSRSFDSYFGTLRGVRGFADPEVQKLSTGRSVFYQPDSLNPDGYELPFPLDSSQTGSQCVADLSHEWDVQHSAWNGGRMDNWVEAHRAADGDTVGPLTMGYYTRADIPFHYALADTFTICDGYHCSVMGPTNPNRLYLWSGTIDPGGRQGGPVIDDSESPFYTWTTYPERLQHAGVSWRVYQELDNYDDNALAWFKRFQSETTPLHRNGMRNRSADAFADDVASGHLPQVSWIIAPAAESEHPSFTPAAGAELTHGYLQALADHPEVWRKTVFLLTWDENDGFFDHVTPPTAPKGTPGEYVGGLPIGLGFRVPMIVISPWSVGGFVCSQTFDHTSIIRLIERRFGVPEPNISKWRRRTCGDLTATLGLGAGQGPHRFPRLANPNGSAERAADECVVLPPPTVPNPQKFPQQEHGKRPRRGEPAPLTPARLG